MPKNFFKKTWKLLTDDPSKGASKKIESPEVVGGKEDKPKILGKSDVDVYPKQDSRVDEKKQTPIKKSISEKLFDIRNLYSTTMNTDISILDIRREHDYRDGYYTPSYGSEKYRVTVKVSGRRMFERLVPDFGFSEIQTMGRVGNPDFTTGVLKSDDITSRVRFVLFDIITEDENWANRGYEFSQDHYNSKLKSIIINRSEVGDITKYKDINIKVPSNIRLGSSDIGDFLTAFESTIKSLIVSEFEDDIRKFKQEREIISIRNDFDNKLDESTMLDLFSYISDEIGDGFSLKRIKDEENQNGRVYPVIGMDEYWRISIDAISTNDKMDMNGNLPKILIEIGEAVCRIKDIYSNCNIDLSYGSSKLLLNIKPIYPNWRLESIKKERSNQANRLAGYGHRQDFGRYGYYRQLYE